MTLNSRLRPERTLLAGFLAVAAFDATYCVQAECMAACHCSLPPSEGSSDDGGLGSHGNFAKSTLPPLSTTPILWKPRDLANALNRSDVTSATAVAELGSMHCRFQIEKVTHPAKQQAQCNVPVSLSPTRAACQQ